MPDRIIRDELLRSHRYVTLSSDTCRLLFVHLILCADSLGNAEATTTSLTLTMMRSIDETTAAKLVAELADADLIRVYESGSKRYVHIPRFRQRLRYIKGKHPRPPAAIECNEMKELLRKARPPSDRGPTTVGRSEEKRSEKNPSANADACGFDEFWKAYPRKKDKQDALKAWKRIAPDEDLRARVMSAVALQKQSMEWQKDGGRFIPYPSTWLNGARWDDEVEQTGAVAGGEKWD